LAFCCWRVCAGLPEETQPHDTGRRRAALPRKTAAALPLLLRRGVGSLSAWQASLQRATYRCAFFLSLFLRAVSTTTLLSLRRRRCSPILFGRSAEDAAVSRGRLGIACGRAVARATGVRWNIHFPQCSRRFLYACFSRGLCLSSLNGRRKVPLRGIVSFCSFHLWLYCGPSFLLFSFRYMWARARHTYMPCGAPVFRLHFAGLPPTRCAHNCAATAGISRAFGETARATGVTARRGVLGCDYTIVPSAAALPTRRRWALFADLGLQPTCACHHACLLHPTCTMPVFCPPFLLPLPLFFFLPPAGCLCLS